MRFFLFSFLLIFLFSGCSKTPESATAKKIGEQPKQIVDKVTSDVNKALQKGTEQRQEAEKKE
jgi:PBP1b-binding outer membrane lipoprotein LpoB